MTEHEFNERRHINWPIVIGTIGMCFTFIVQLVATVWFGATFMATTGVKLDGLKDDLTALRTNAYTKEQAHSDMLRMEQRETDLDRRVLRVESMLDNGTHK